MSDTLSRRVSDLIKPSIEAMGFDLVRVMVSGGRRQVLQIMAERASDGTMSVDDCAEISRNVSAILDVEDPIKSEYTLEVSSPGIDRPLTRLKDFERFAGFDARVELSVGFGIEGQKKFTGKLAGVGEGRTILIDLEDGERRELPFADMAKAKLLLTDELLAAAKKGQM